MKINLKFGTNNFLFVCFPVYNQTFGVTLTTANGCQSPTANTNLHTAMVSDMYTEVKQV